MKWHRYTNISNNFNKEYNKNNTLVSMFITSENLKTGDNSSRRINNVLEVQEESFANHHQYKKNSRQRNQ